MSEINKKGTPHEYHDAFEQTDFVVYPTQNESFTISIHQYNSKLFKHFPDLNTWAVITAWNPLPDILAKEENLSRNMALENELKSLGLNYCASLGIAKDKSWSEESYFIENCTQLEANSLAKKFGQLAFVFGEIKQPSQLIYTTFE